LTLYCRSIERFFWVYSAICSYYKGSFVLEYQWYMPKRCPYILYQVSLCDSDFIKRRKNFCRLVVHCIYYVRLGNLSAECTECIWGIRRTRQKINFILTKQLLLACC